MPTLNSILSRLRLGALLVVASASILAGCSASAQVAERAEPTSTSTSQAPAPSSTPVDATEEPAQVATPTSTPFPAATATPATLDTEPSEPADQADAAQVPPGLSRTELDTYSLALPEEWIVLRDPADVDRLDPAFFQTPDDALLAESMVGLLELEGSFIAVDADGDNVNVIRQPGPAAAIANPDVLASQIEIGLAGFATDIELTATTTTTGDADGVLVSGTYNINGADAHIYQLSTHHDGQLYFVTVTLMTGDDQLLAAQIFSSLRHQ